MKLLSGANMKLRSGANGATLLVMLVMLAMITLFVLSMMRASGARLKSIGQMQAQRVLEAAAQQAIEAQIGSREAFAANGRDTVRITIDGYPVIVERPRCILARTAEDSAEAQTGGWMDSYWEIAATASDAANAVSVNVLQGIRVRSQRGCPARPDGSRAGATQADSAAGLDKRVRTYWRSKVEGVQARAQDG